ncbi:MAG: hypothetical protein AAF570_25780 [Bacteroidota bacterium]
MRKSFFLMLFAFAIVFAACSREEITSNEQAPTLALSESGILIEGDDADVILQNIDDVRDKLHVIAMAMAELSQDADFAEVVAQPLRDGTKAGNFAQPLGELISTDGTNSGIEQAYLSSMEASVGQLGGTAEQIASVRNIAASFQIAGETVYPKVTVSIIGARQGVEEEAQPNLDIRPQYIALSQSYSPGTLPAWEITEEGIDPVNINPATIYEANVWYIGIADIGPGNTGSGLAFKLLAQGEDCSCTVAASGSCIEEASNGTMKINCGSTDVNCNCPSDCSGAGNY